jgi:hypothetical protein
MAPAQTTEQGKQPAAGKDFKTSLSAVPVTLEHRLPEDLDSVIPSPGEQQLSAQLLVFAALTLYRKSANWRSLGLFRSCCSETHPSPLEADLPPLSY